MTKINLIGRETTYSWKKDLAVAKAEQTVYDKTKLQKHTIKRSSDKAYSLNVSNITENLIKKELLSASDLLNVTGVPEDISKILADMGCLSSNTTRLGIYDDISHAFYNVTQIDKGSNLTR